MLIQLLGAGRCASLAVVQYLCMGVMERMLITVAAHLLEGIGPFGMFFSFFLLIATHLMHKTTDHFLLIARKKVG